MASTEVEASFLAAIQAVDPAVPIIPTEAVRVDNTVLPDLFILVNFSSGDTRRMSLGPFACYRETGIVNTTVMVRSGQGKTDAQALATLISAALRDYTDPAINLWAIDTTTPEAVDTESNGRWFGVNISTGFNRDFFN